MNWLVMDWLLGLDRMSTEDVRAHLGWGRPMSTTVCLLFVLVALLLAGWSYHQLSGRRVWRMGLGLLRGLLLMLLLLMIATPQLVIQQERVEPDWVFMLVDRSASMQIRDMWMDGGADGVGLDGGVGGRGGSGGRGGLRVSRDAVLRDALRLHGDAFTEASVGDDRRLVWLGFDEVGYEIAPPTDGFLPEAVGGGTHLRTAIDEALQRGVGRPISAVVLITDGRSDQSTDEDVVNRLEQLATCVIVVPMGASDVPMDLGIGRIDAPDKAFVNEPVPVRVWVDRSMGGVGGGGGEGGVGGLGVVRVRLIDPVTEELMDEQVMSSEVGVDEPVRLTGRWSMSGPTVWRVEVWSSESSEELITENNVMDVSIEFVDRPMRVLFVEGYPRWEYRYLKNMLIRSDAIQASVLLLSADANFAQEGNLPITRLPREAEELSSYDVVIIGDVAASQFSADQMSMLRDHVSIRGAGLLWIGGPYWTPTSYGGTALGDLLPMRVPSRTGVLDFSMGPFDVEPTSLASGLGVLELVDPREGSGVDRDYTGGGVRWPGDLPGLQWVQDVGLIKPTAEVLAMMLGSDVGGGDAGVVGVPGVIRLRYGAGQALYVATDETWRWRYGRGELYFEQFWMQLVQMLGRGRLDQRNDGIGLSVSHRRSQVGEPLVVRLRIEDVATLERQLGRVAMEVVYAGVDEFVGDGVNEDGRVGVIERFELLPKPERQSGGRDYEAIWTPGVDGSLMLDVVEPTLVDWGLRQPVEVIRPDDEMRQIASDHDRLLRLAKQTGGAVVGIGDLDRVLDYAPNRAKRIPVDMTETIWDSPLGLMLVMGLLMLEWVGRKMIQLV